jgi:hypothetical protein
MTENLDSAYDEPAALRRAAEVLSAVLHDAQRRLAEEAVASASAKDDTRPAKPDPKPYVDLTPYEGMPDADVLRALGARGRDEISYYKRALQRERSSDVLRSVRNEDRCEAGVPSQLGIRCTRAALPGERWCRRHHPRPPVTVQTEAEEARARLRRDQLWQRPDGRVLEALYTLTDRVEELCDTTRDALDRAHRLQAAASERANAAWLNADEAAEYTRRFRSVVTRAAAAGELSGVRQGTRGPWSFRPADLDTWLESGRYNSGRYYAPSPRARRSRRT